MEHKTIVNTSGIITISVEEYRQLVAAQAYLDAILEARKREKSCRADNMLDIISQCANTVITDEKPVSRPKRCITNA